MRFIGGYIASIQPAHPRYNSEIGFRASLGNGEISAPIRATYAGAVHDLAALKDGVRFKPDEHDFQFLSDKH